ADIDNTVKTEISSTESVLTSYINEATRKITGGKGGFIKFNFNANGLPEELLIMSASTELTSQNIIRMNQAGIGFSTDFGSTYRSAWTIDGVFNADFITAGSLSAARITSGILQDSNSYTTFNLSTGVLTMTKGSITLGTAENGVYPFSVTDQGALTAVSATLVNASLSGTITTEYGMYKSMLDSGYLRMFYDSTLYGQFGGGAWGANTQKRGLGMYLAEDASYMFFGRYETTAGSYIASYIINFGLSSQELGYDERHIFYSTARFLGNVTMGGTLTMTGAATANGTLTATAGLYLSNSNAYFDNTTGLSFKDTSGSYHLAMYMSNTDRIFLASTTNPVQVYGSTTYLGSTAYPTVIAGSTVKATSLIKTGIETIVCSTDSTQTASVIFPEAFTASPVVLLTAVDPNKRVTWLSASNISRTGFTINIHTSYMGTIYVHWAAVYQPAS
ncbi:MAG: hypothetical protein IJT77_11980, partial [Clostridia bacterium]|nr:hypothetical protein [Clostridia bacterium]